MQRQLEHPFIHSLHDCWQTQRHLFISELSPNPNPQLQPRIEASLVEMSPVLPEVIQKITAPTPTPTTHPPTQTGKSMWFHFSSRAPHTVSSLSLVSNISDLSPSPCSVQPLQPWRLAHLLVAEEPVWGEGGSTLCDRAGQCSGFVLLIISHGVLKEHFTKNIPVQSLLAFIPCGSRALSVHFHWLGALSGDFNHDSFLFVIFLSYILTPHLLFVIPGFIHDLGIMHRDVKV